jgi:hypothetical protein
MEGREHELALAQVLFLVEQQQRARPEDVGQGRAGFPSVEGRGVAREHGADLCRIGDVHHLSNRGEAHGERRPVAALAGVEEGERPRHEAQCLEGTGQPRAGGQAVDRPRVVAAHWVA